MNLFAQLCKYYAAIWHKWEVGLEIFTGEKWNKPRDWNGCGLAGKRGAGAAQAGSVLWQIFAAVVCLAYRSLGAALSLPHSFGQAV